MATMLAFITTDAAISKAALQRAVSDAAARSFNMVIVDGDTSTNDSFITLANGNAGNERIAGPEHPLYPAFYEALLAVAQDLAKLIARDGEGATKFLTVAVKGAADFADAGRIARAIAKSPLVKTAFFGEDPNWGRIICAAGYAGAVFDPEGLTVALNGERIFAGGRGLSVQKEKIRSVMRERDIIIEINLDAGEAEATLWTCDFSYDYVKINAEYHT
jgi:glutamate N-acetyltransferase/amino-acid N-acetyltransferase